MNLATYSSLSGLTVSSADQNRVTANITKTQTILESMLGFTLNPADADANLYNELGKTALECPCSSIDLDTLDDPDAVQGAYRLFNYNYQDKYLSIDPCSEVYAVKLVRDNVTVKTLEELDDYRKHKKFDFIKYLEMCIGCFNCSESCTNCVQLAVDADWLWTDEDDIPSELNQVWVEMITWYSDLSKDLKSQTLATHSWTRANTTPPELREANIAVIQKYAGANGSIKRTITL